jgi:hypothetical protein
MFDKISIDKLKLTMASPPDCPNAANHTDGPAGYLAWHAWADAMGRTRCQR